MKKFDDNLLIEYKVKHPVCIANADWRYVYYRIKPKQLNWWDRIFNNGWKKMWKACWDGDKLKIFTLKSFKKISGFTTYGEVRKYIMEQIVTCASNKQEIIEYRKEMAKKGEIWPDEIYNF